MFQKTCLTYLKWYAIIHAHMEGYGNLELLRGIPDKQVYTLQEVATALGKSKRTIRNWIKKGDLEAFRLGNRIMFRYEQLARLLKVPEPDRAPPPDTPYGEYE